MVSPSMYAIPSALVLLYLLRKYREWSWGSCKNKEQLDNKVAVITGANCGIGYEIAKELAARNALVILACRNMDLAQKAIREIQKQLKNSATLIAMELDLASLESIKKFASNLQKEHPKIHILVNNAGVSYPYRKLHFTKDDFEIHFGVNYLGHFYLTNLLLDTIKASSPSRIVVIGSTLHVKGLIDFNNLNKKTPEKSRARKGRLYADSKLENLYFCVELARRVKNSGVNVYGVCPGWAHTNLFRHALTWYHYMVVAPFALMYLRSAKQGAQTAIYCITEPSLVDKTGFFYRDCQVYQSPIEFKSEIAKQLWEESEKMIQEKIK